VVFDGEFEELIVHIETANAFVVVAWEWTMLGAGENLLGVPRALQRCRPQQTEENIT
jgi:hypothetical protein